MQYIDFKELKAKVGVTDVASALGYRLDKAAGVGRYAEYVLGQGSGKTDCIVVRNPGDRAAQTYFRRDGSRGDVITLIRENLSAFNAVGSSDWEKIAAVMTRLAGQPAAMTADAEYIRAKPQSAVFDPGRYEVGAYIPGQDNGLLASRGLSGDTAAVFAPFMRLIRDRQNPKFRGFNVAFPYTTGADSPAVGYEIRGGKGYKSKAAGTDSSTAAWVADLSCGKPWQVSNVYFFESAFDAMAFYQFNRASLDRSHIALVSLGGTFSDGQIESVMRRYPHARMCSCFDNDLAGQTYAVRLQAIVTGQPLKVSKDGDTQVYDFGGIVTRVGSSDLARTLSLVSQCSPITRHIAQWHAPANFKDWNDCLRGISDSLLMPPSKYERDERLAARRKL